MRLIGALKAGSRPSKEREERNEPLVDDAASSAGVALKNIHYGELVLIEECDATEKMTFDPSIFFFFFFIQS